MIEMMTFFKIMKIITGFALIILGAIGTLIPIPLVPFFLLILLGLHILGRDAWVQKIRASVNERIHHHDGTPSKKEAAHSFEHAAGE